MIPLARDRLLKSTLCTKDINLKLQKYCLLMGSHQNLWNKASIRNKSFLLLSFNFFHQQATLILTLILKMKKLKARLPAKSILYKNNFERSTWPVIQEPSPQYLQRTKNSRTLKTSGITLLLRSTLFKTKDSKSKKSNDLWFCLSLRTKSEEILTRTLCIRPVSLLYPRNWLGFHLLLVLSLICVMNKH